MYVGLGVGVHPFMITSSLQDLVTPDWLLWVVLCHKTQFWEEVNVFVQLISNYYSMANTPKSIKRHNFAENLHECHDGGQGGQPGKLPVQ